MVRTGLGSHQLIQNGLARTFPHRHDGWHRSDGSFLGSVPWERESNHGLNLHRPVQRAFNVVQQVSVHLLTLFEMRDDIDHCEQRQFLRRTSQGLFASCSSFDVGAPDAGP